MAEQEKNYLDLESTAAQVKKSIEEIVEKLTEKLAYVVEKSKTSTSYMPTDIRVNVFDKQQIDEFKIQLSELKKDKREYQDTLLELNMSTQIELSNQIVDVLKKHHLL